jgi:hypothetical protein
MERATGIEPVLPAWESTLSALYFQYLQNRPIKICVHAAHTVHALPDLRLAGGRFGGRFLSCVAVRDRRFEAYFFVPEASRYSRFRDDKLSMVRRSLYLNLIPAPESRP